MKIDEAQIGKHVRDWAGTVYRVVCVDVEGPHGKGRRVTLQNPNDMHDRVVCGVKEIGRYRKLKEA